jgi:HSP20 family protein
MNNAVTKNEKQRPAQQQAPQNQNQVQQNANRGYMSPRVNIKETKDGYLLEAEMPGVNKDGLEISLEGNELTLVGRRHEEAQGLELVYKESTGRDYRRVFVLDPTIDTRKVEAKIDNGVLHLHLPKAEEVKPRKIAVTG